MFCSKDSCNSEDLTFGIQEELTTMERYKKMGGDSGVVAYEIGPDSIKVEFSDGALYLYNNQSAGTDSIALMKKTSYCR